MIVSQRGLRWALAQSVKPTDRASVPSVKFVLVSLGWYASNDGAAWPTVEALADRTMLDPRTVRDALRGLAAQGLISDTGRRVGPTRRTKVWRLNAGDWPGFNAGGSPGSNAGGSPRNPGGTPAKSGRYARDSKEGKNTRPNNKTKYVSSPTRTKNRNREPFPPTAAGKRLRALAERATKGVE